jgi:hypothetical protein
MPTQEESIQAWLRAVAAGVDPNAISAYAGAVGSGIPPEVAANPSAYKYDYGADPTGQAYLRNEAFAPVQSYDYRTDPSFLQATRGFQYGIDETNLRAEHDLGNLNVLQPVTESDIMANRDEALRNVDLSAEARGIYQSGERATNRARTTGDYGRQLTGVQLSGALQRGNVEFDRAQALAEIERRRADTLAQYSNPPNPGAPPGG